MLREIVCHKVPCDLALLSQKVIKDKERDHSRVNRKMNGGCLKALALAQDDYSLLCSTKKKKKVMSTKQNEVFWTESLLQAMVQRGSEQSELRKICKSIAR